MKQEQNTVLKEVGEQLWNEMTDRWSSNRWKRFNSNKMLEHDVSAIICSLMGSSQKHAIEYMCNRVGHEISLSHKYFISTANDKSVEHLLRKRRFDDSGWCSIQPDILICRIDSFGNVEIIVSIELKKSAQVNYIKCPSGRHLKYSNQIICYADNCWLLDNVNTSNISYVWLCRESFSSIENIEKSALSGNPAKDEKFGGTFQAYEYQSYFLGYIWKICSFESFIESFEKDSPLIVEKLNRWISS